MLGVIGAASLLGLSSLIAQQPAPTPPAAPPQPKLPELTDAEVTEISSYFLGHQAASRFAGSGLESGDISQEHFLKGFYAALKNEEPAHGQDKTQAALKKLGDIMKERSDQEAAKNLAAGNEFLAKNAKADGVTMTKSGLQYKILKKGEGKTYQPPAAGAQDAGTRFMVNYRGTLIDGTEFDKSPEGQPVPMPLEVIPGFKEALTMMPVGSRWQLFIPANLAYGAQRRGPKIAPNSTLIFDLELVDIKTPPAAPAKPNKPVVPVNPPKPKPTATTPPVEVPAPPAKK